MRYLECSQSTNDPCVVVEENKCKFKILNRSGYSIRKIQVDGCLIVDDREKCDWIVAIDNEKLLKAMYIELKGKKIDKAVSQLKSTLDITKDNFKKYDKECYVVTTRFPKGGVDHRKIQIDFMRATKVALKVKNILCEIVV